MSPKSINSKLSSRTEIAPKQLLKWEKNSNFCRKSIISYRMKTQSLGRSHSSLTPRDTFRSSCTQTLFQCPSQSSPISVARFASFTCLSINAACVLWEGSGSEEGERASCCWCSLATCARYRDGTDLTRESHGLLFLECFKINICLGFENEGDSIRWSRLVTTWLMTFSLPFWHNHPEWFFDGEKTLIRVQRSEKWLVHGWVKFVPALA